MVTKQLLKRDLFGSEISQNSLNGFFSANDLVKAGNNWRISKNLPLFKLGPYLQYDSVKEFIHFLEEQEGQKVLISSRGRNAVTWVHPFLFIKIALALSPELEVKVYSWLYDSLVKYRNSSGDSYKKMCGALYLTQENKRNFPEDIQLLALRIKKECGVEDWNKATEEQLLLRDRIHNNIALLSDILQDRKNLYAVAIKKAKENK